MIARYYYEAHISLVPVTPGGEERRELLGIAALHGAKLASFAMNKEDKKTPDAFITFRGSDYNQMVATTMRLVRDLILFGFKVKRYKIEDTLLDSNREDTLQLLAEGSNNL